MKLVGIGVHVVYPGKTGHQYFFGVLACAAAAGLVAAQCVHLEPVQWIVPVGPGVIGSR